MTRHTVWGASAPPGTYDYYTDGSPGIWTAMGFYRTVSGTQIDTVVGARLWVSAAALAANSSVSIRVWRGGQFDAGLGAVETGWSTPLETKTMPITQTGWNEVDFAAAFTCAVGERIYLAVKFDGNGNAYQHSGNLADGGVVLAENGMGFALGASVNQRGVYKIGTSSLAVTSANALYGLDIIFDDGVGSDTTPPSVPTGLTVDSVTHNSASVHWTASTDDVAVTGYEVFRDGTSVGTTTTSTSFVVAGCAASTTYGFTVRARDAAGNWSAESSSTGFTTTAAPAANGSWINHVALLAAGNGTTTHTIGPGSVAPVKSGAPFTPAAGNLLLCVVSGAVTSSTPTGWTLPSGTAAIASSGLYAWWKTAAGGGDALTTTHNASNYPVIFDFYEFPAGSTFVGTGSSEPAVGNGNNGAPLSGMTGTNLIIFAGGRGIQATSGTDTATWSVGTKVTDAISLRTTGTIDGTMFSTAALVNFTGSSTVSAFGWTGLTGSGTAERISFTINVVESTTSTTGSISASLPKITGSVPGASLDLGTINAPLPAVTGSITGGVTTTGTTSAALPKVTGNVPGGPRLTIAQENALTTGVADRSYWFSYAADTIPGFARSSYYKPGQVARFSVDYNSAYTAQVWRLGWYGAGNGNARKVAEFAGTTAAQPAATVIPGSNGAVTCAAWTENVTWAIPGDATPGWYWLFMRNAGGTDFGGVLFCVSDQDAKKPILVVSSEATWAAAYNGYGGNNVYGASTSIGSITGRALCSTYDKPVISRDNVPQTHFFNGELATLRFLERFGFEVGYTTCEQINNDPTVMDGRELIIFSGHNEYISQRIRDKTAAVIAAGTNVANLAGNDFFWRTAYGDESGFPAGATNTSTGRVMWCIARGEMVTTRRGRVAIETVREDDLVLTRDGWLPVQHVTQVGRKRTVKVVLSDGRSILCTPDHRIALADGGWREAGSLRFGDDLVALDDVPGDPVTGAVNADVVDTPHVERGGCLVDEAGLLAGGVSSAFDALSVNTASSGTSGVHERVLRGELVPLGAVGGAVSMRPIAADVLAVGDELQMPGIDAKLDSAQVVERHGPVVRQGGHEDLPDDAVRLGDDAVPAQVPVVVVVGAGPEPVSVRGIEVDLRPDPVRKTDGIHVHHITVVSVEQDDVRDVYDIGVNGRPEFLVNGIVVHNCRKDTMTGPTAIGHTAGTPFSTQADWTGTWQDTRYTNRQTPADLLGDRFIANGLRDDEVKVPFVLKSAPIWRDVAPVQALTSGQEFAFGIGTAGMEWDMPAGTLQSVSLSASTVTITGGASDVNGEAYNLTGTYTHSFQMVRNGAGYIFNGNTTQWGWALDNLHLRGSPIATVAAQQATLNVLYDLGAAGVTALITGGSLVEPTPVSDIGVAYGLLPQTTGTVSGQLPGVTGAVAGVSTTPGTLSAQLPPVTGTVTGVSEPSGAISAALPPITGAVTGQSLTAGTLAGQMPKITADVPGFSTVVGNLRGDLPKITGGGGGVVWVTGAATGALPRIRGMITLDNPLNNGEPVVIRLSRRPTGRAYRTTTLTRRRR